MNNRAKIFRAIDNHKLHIVKKCNFSAENGEQDKTLLGDALSEAAYKGDIAIAEFLITVGADVNHNRSECLASAAMGGQTEMYRFLVSMGADEFAEQRFREAKGDFNKWSRSPLYWACYHGHLDMLEEILLTDIDLERTDAFLGAIEFFEEHAELREKGYAVIECLLKHGLGLDYALQRFYGLPWLWLEKNEAQLRDFETRKEKFDHLETVLPQKPEKEKPRVLKI